MTKWVKHFGHTKLLTTHLLKQSYTPFYMELKLYFLLNINFFFTQNCYLKKNKQVRRMCVFDFLNQKHFMKIVSRYNKEQNVIKHYFLELLTKGYDFTYFKQEIQYLLFEDQSLLLTKLMEISFENGMEHMLYTKSIPMVSTRLLLKMV